MADTSFVRTEMLEEQAPPPTSVGVIGWLRANLFSSVINSIMTVIAVAFIIYILSGLLPWIFLSETQYDSLKNCREVFFIKYGAGIHGHACWSVITERWIQLLYGFYPSDAYWRPNLALVLLFVALAPILFADSVPRQLLFVTAAYPFIMPWLMWGGAIWSPLLVFAGLVVGYFVYRALTPIGGALLGIPAAALAVVIWLLFLMSPINHFINKMVASPQMDSRAASLAVTIDELTPVTEEMDAKLKALNAEILVGEKERGELFKVLEGLQETGLEEGKTEKEIRATPEFQTAAAAFMEKLDAITLIKAEARELGRTLSLQGGELGNAEFLLQRIKALPEAEAQLPELNKAYEAALAELPDKFSGLTEEGQVANLGIETTQEELELFRAYLSAEDARRGAENLITQTYAEVGRIGLKPVTSRLFGGFMLAILIGVVAIMASLPIGIVLALGRQSDLLIVKAICVGFIEFIRGVPLITLLFVASTLLNIFLPPGTNFDIIVRVMIMVTLFAAAYMAEVIRGGLAALPKGQYEGADSLGLDYWQAQRLIIMPQALKISIPGIVSTFIGVFKDTTLVSVISILDPLGLSQGIRSNAAWNGIYWELFAFIAALFFVVCFGMSRYSMYLERKLRTDHR